MSDDLFDKSNDNLIRQNGLIMTTDEVVDLLNSQSKLISAYQYEFVKMRKENEMLKSENKKLQCINDHLEEQLENSGIGIALKMDCENDE